MAENNSKPQKPKELTQIAVDVALSGFAAVVGKTIVAPVERVKLILQTQASNPSMIKNESAQYKGIIDCFSRITKEQGIGSFWRGNLATLLKYVPLQILNFTAYAKIKRMFPIIDRRKYPVKFFLTNLLKGGTAGAISIMVVYPLDYIKTKMATDLGKKPGEREFNGFTDCVKKVARQGGIRSFYTAFPLSLAGVFVYRAIYFGLYESAIWSEKGNFKGLTASFLFATLSTNTAGLVVYPFDTVRRNMVIQSAKSAGEKNLKLDDGVLKCAQRLYRERGIQGLYAGCLINLIRGIGGSLVLVFYDSMKAYSKGKH